MKIKTLLFLICLTANLTPISTLQCAAAAGAGAASKEEADKKTDNDYFILSFDKGMQTYLDFSSDTKRPPVISFGMKSGSFWGWKPTDKYIGFEKIDTKDNNISFKFKINNKINDKEEIINKILLGGKQNAIEVKPDYRYYFFDLIDSENNELMISSNEGSGGIFVNLGVDGEGAMDLLFIDDKFDLFPKFVKVSPIVK